MATLYTQYIGNNRCSLTIHHDFADGWPSLAQGHLLRGSSVSGREYFEFVPTTDDEFVITEPCICEPVAGCICVASLMQGSIGTTTLLAARKGALWRKHSYELELHVLLGSSVKVVPYTLRTKIEQIIQDNRSPPSPPFLPRELTAMWVQQGLFPAPSRDPST